MNNKLPQRVYLSLGSNQGDRLFLLINALHDLKLQSIGSTRISGIYETDPWGFDADQPFYNIVVEMWFDLPPRNLLNLCLAIENQLGRKRVVGAGYRSRPIDIDILFYGDKIICQPALTLPHPKLHLRRFVLEPMAELTPGFIHPVFKKSIAELLEVCPDQGRVVYLNPFPEAIDNA